MKNYFTAIGFNKKEEKFIAAYIKKNNVKSINTIVTQELADELGVDIGLCIHPSGQIALIKL